MSGLFQRLVSGLPARYTPTRNAFASDVKSLRAWLAQLPLANPGATARLLIGALREMNQLRIDPMQRFEALELMRAPVNQIVSTLIKQTLGDRFPLPRQKAQLGQLAQDFENELALGYCAVIHDLCAPAGAVPFLRGKTVALALTRALQHRGACLYQAYLRYSAPPLGAWQNLHDLFGFAVSVQLDDKFGSDPLYGEAQISARMVYIHALLFALCNPYRFTQRSNAEIYALTRIWAANCEVRQGPAPSGATAIRMDADQSLGYLPEERETPSEGLWALEISGLQRLLEGQLAMLPPGIEVMQFRLRGGPAVHTGKSLVERLMRCWEASVERHQQRLAAGHVLDTVVGMHDLHFVLAGDINFETFLRRTRGVGISLQDSERGASWTNTGSSETGAARRQAKVLDQSLGGYRLLWQNVDGIRLRVGELIGLAPPVDDDEIQDWMIGALRWLRIDASGAIDAGVELLARRVLPVALRTLDREGVPRPAVRGALLDDPVATESVANIGAVIVPMPFDTDATRVELTRPGDPYSWPAEPRVDILADMQVDELEGDYLRLEFGEPAHSATSGDADYSAAANDDQATSAADTATR